MSNTPSKEPKMLYGAGINAFGFHFSISGFYLQILFMIN